MHRRRRRSTSSSVSSHCRSASIADKTRGTKLKSLRHLALWLCLFFFPLLNPSVSLSQSTGCIGFSSSASMFGEAAGTQSFLVEWDVAACNVLTFFEFATVDYVVIPGTATNPADFDVLGPVGVSGTIELGDAQGGTLPNGPPVPIVVSIVSDTIFEGNHGFSIQLSNPQLCDIYGSGCSPSSLGTGLLTATIVDDDPPPLPGSAEITESAIPINEAGAGTVTVTIARTGGTTQPLFLEIITESGTATAVSDFVPAGNQFSWAANDVTNRTFDVDILDDFDVEGAEDFAILLGTDLSGSVPDVIDSATITIVDNDTPPVARISPEFLTVAEGGSTGSDIVVSNVGNSSACDVDVSTISLTGGATAGADYAPLTSTTLLSIPPGGSVVVPAINVLTDGISPEAGETFLVELSGTPTSNSPCQLTDNIMTTVTIEDMPPLAVPTASITASTSVQTVAEGTSVDIDVELSAGTGSCEVDIATIDGTATSQGDFTFLSTTITVGPTQTISVPVLTDLFADDDEVFTVQLLMPSVTNQFPACEIDNTTATITIDDVPPPAAATASITASTILQSADEGSTVDVEVELSAGTGLCIVDIATVNGTAVAPADFTPQSSTLTVGPTQVLSIPLLADLVGEGSEVFTVQLFSAASTGSVPACELGDSTATITIDDVPPPVAATASITASTLVQSADEGSTVDVEVELSAGTGVCVVDVATVNGTAVAPADFTAQSSTLTVGPTQVLSIPLLTDLIGEGSEAFTVQLFTAASPGSVPACELGDSTATITIDDVPPPVAPTASITAGTLTQNALEGTTVDVDVELSSGTGSCVVDVATVNGTAIAPGDFMAQANRFTVGPTQTLSIPVLTDLVVDSTETFSVQLSTAASPGQLPACDLGNTTATITIIDVPPPVAPTASITMATLTQTVAEGATVDVDVELSAGTASCVVDVATVNGTAIAPGDFAAQSSSFTVGPTQTLSVPLLSDLITEGTEVFTVQLSTAASPGQLPACELGNSTATITVSDVAPPAAPTASITTATLSQSAAEGTTVNVGVELSAGTGTCVVDVATVNGTATAPDDYTAQLSSLTVGPTQTLSIPLQTDLALEGSETFTVQLSTAATPGQLPACDLGNSTATIAIIDVPPPVAAPVVQFSGSSTAFTVNENGVSPVLTVQLTSGTGPASVNISTANGSALAPGDYASISQIVQIPANQTSVQVPTSILTDNLIEPNESFTVNLSPAPGSSTVVGNNNQSTITIVDATPVIPAVVEFADNSTSFTLNENGISPVLTIVVTSGNVPASVIISTNDGTAVQPGDYEAVNNVLNFPAGNTSQTQRVEIWVDQEVEPVESLTVSLTPAPGSSTQIGANDLATITIIDTTPIPQPVIEFDATSTSVTIDENAGVATFTLVMSSGFGPATVFLSSQDNTAFAGQDFAALPAATTISFPDNAVAGSTQSFTVAILADSEQENNEMFALNLVAGDGVSIGAQDQSIVTITDNFVAPVVQFSDSSIQLSVDENSGDAVLEIVLSSGAGPASIQVATSTINSTATASADYAPVNTVIEFDSSAQQGSTQTVSIPILGDSLIEGAETISVTITPAPGSGTVVGGNNQATITINDSTVVAVVEISEGSRQIDVVENTGSVLLDIVIVEGSAPASVEVNAFDISATAGTDYNAFSQTVVFPSGSSSQTIEIPIIPDEEVEGREEFLVTLAATPGTATAISQNNSATVGIVDPLIVNVEPGQIQFTSAQFEVLEEDGVARLELLRVGGSSGNVSVTYSSADGTAQAGSDYVGNSGTVSWEDGDNTPREIIVDLLDDDQPEQSETFSVQLVSTFPFGNDVQLGTPETATVVVNDSDVTASSGQIQFASDRFEVSEEDGVVRLELLRVGGSSGNVSATYFSADATAQAGSDYVGTTGTVVWEDGDDTPREIVIDLINDDLPEQSETFSLQLDRTFPLGNDVQLGTPATATILVNDSDVDAPPGQIQFASDRFEVSEEDGVVRLELLRVGGSSGNVSATYSSADATAQAGSDYVGTTGSVTWEDGDDTPREIVVNLINDDLPEQSETFIVRLDRAFPIGNDVQLGTPQEASVVVNDSDVAAPPGRIQFSSALFEATEEAGVARLELVRVGGSSGNVSVSYFTADDTALAGSDYVTNTGTVVWEDGDDTPKEILVEITSDAEVEQSEILNVVLDRAFPFGNDIQLGTPQVASVLITDGNNVTDPGQDTNRPEDGTPEVEPEPGSAGIIAFSAETVEVNEDENQVTLELLRSGGTSGDVSVTYSSSNGTAVDGEDYSAAIGTISWADGDDTPRQIVVELINDSLQEDTETFNITLDQAFPLGNEIQLGEPRTAIVIIFDADLMPESPSVPSTPVTNEPSDPSRYILSLVGEPERVADLGENVTDLGFEVRDTSTGNSLAPGVTVLWSAQPQGSVEFPDGNVTVSDAQGLTFNRVIVLDTGFIRIIGEAQGNPVVELTNQSVTGLQPRIEAPPFEVPSNAAFFTLRVGLQAAPSLSLNQSETGRALDNACLALRALSGNLTNLTNNAGETVDQQAQLDLINSCNALENSETLAADLDRMAPEEFFLISDSIIGTTDLQVTNIYSRINAIRNGSREALDLSGLRLSIEQETVPGNVVNAAQNALYDYYRTGETTGGGASDDSSLAGSKLGIFVNGAIGYGEIEGGINANGNQQDAEVTTSGLTVGADYRVNDKVVVGAGLGIVHNDTDFTSTQGGASIDGVNLSVFGTWYSTEKGYFDIVVDIGRNSYQMERQINLTSVEDLLIASSETDASVGSLTIGAGKSFNRSGWEFGPYARLSITQAEVDGFSERTNSAAEGFGSVLDVESHEIRSTTLSAGGQISKTISNSKAVVVPQLRIELEGEDQRVKDGITASFQADPSNTAFTVFGNERDNLVVNYGFGASAVFPRGHSGFLFFEGRAADDFVIQNWLKLGYRFEFR